MSLDHPWSRARRIRGFGGFAPFWCSSGDPQNWPQSLIFFWWILLVQVRYHLSKVKPKLEFLPKVELFHPFSQIQETGGESLGPLGEILVVIDSPSCSGAKIQVSLDLEVV